jgi:hypothetical protein
MLAADRRLLGARVKQRRLEIKTKEIGFYVASFNMIATQGAVLAGFSFGAFSRSDWNVLQVGHRVTFANCCAASMSLNLAAVIFSTFASVLGPKMALLGKQGSTFRACDLLRKYHTWVTKLHIAGLFFFFLSCLDYGFLLFDNNSEATALCSQLIVAVVGIFWFMTHMFTEFDFVEEDFEDEDYIEFQKAKAAEVAVQERSKGPGSGRAIGRDNVPDLDSSFDSKDQTHSKFKKLRAFASGTADAVAEQFRPQTVEVNEVEDIGIFASGDSRRLVKAGIATKQGRSIGRGMRKNWQARYFELYRDWLVYYESKDGPEKGRMCLYDSATEAELRANRGSGAMTGSLRGSGVSSSFSFTGISKTKEFAMEITPTPELEDSSLKEYKVMPNGLQIKSPFDCIYMDFQSEDDRDDWAEAIRSCAENAKSSRSAGAALKKSVENARLAVLASDSAVVV